MMRSVWVICFFVSIFTGTAHAQFTVGGVTGGAPTTDVNCFGDADGKILAYSQGWTAADCGIYTLVCNANQFTCPPANTLCTDGDFCGAGGPHVSITSPSSTETAALEAINTDPTITALNCSNASAGITYSCPVLALDAEGNTLTYSTDAQAITGWLSINPNTGILSGTPNVSGAVPEFTVTVTDGYTGSASATSNSFSVTNIPPAFANVTCPIATVGTSYVCATGASDSEGHSITYTKVTGPDWIEVASNGNLTADTVGSSTSVIRLRANDGYDNTTSADYNIALNNAPAFNSISCADGEIGSPYNCSISSYDDDSDNITFTLSNAPSWASVNSFGDVVATTPEQGTYTGLTVTADDGIASTVSEPFSITINLNTEALLADASSTLTVADIDNLETLGVAVNIVNDLKNNDACGSTGDQNCLAAFNAQKAISTCTLENGSNATAAQMQAYISCVMIEHHTTIANAVSVPSTSSTSGNSCTVAVTGPVPSTCAHPQWTCTIEGEPTPTGWQVTQSAGLSYASIDLTTSNGAPVTGSYTVRASLGIYTPAYSKAYTYNDVNIPTSPGAAANSLSEYSGGKEHAGFWNYCIDRGKVLATEDEIKAHKGWGSLPTGFYLNGNYNPYSGFVVNKTGVDKYERFNCNTSSWSTIPFMKTIRSGNSWRNVTMRGWSSGTRLKYVDENDVVRTDNCRTRSYTTATFFCKGTNYSCN